MYRFRQALRKLESEGKLSRVEEDTSLEKISNRIKKSNEAILFENTGTEYSLASNICTRENFYTIFSMNWKQIQEKVIEALENPIKPVEAGQNFFEEADLDLLKLPILKYYKSDPGVYITSGVFIVECEKRNLAYHRILVKDKDFGTARICHRHTWECYIKQNRDVDVAICIGMDPALLFAAAISTREPLDETEIQAAFMESQ
jgi:2,5-furandicarboxylate decarboxylase 1